MTAPETPETCKDFVGRGWRDHAEDAAGVMDRFEHGITLVAEASDLPGLAGLIAHVAGEHLGRWQDGLALLDRLATHELCGEAQTQAIARSQAVLRFCTGDLGGYESAWRAGHSGEHPERSTRARVLAVATCALAGQGRLPEALATFKDTLALIETGVEASDPVNRSIAISANNLACELEEVAERTPEQDELLELAAKTARRFWEVAGTWNNVQVAEYRLCMSYLALARPEPALEHARAALELCEANQAGPTDLLFAQEALARANHALGRGSAAAAARDAMVAHLPNADPSWGDYPKQTLAKVQALLG
jgi:tetratricopeptide (TPR) repeat protein